MNTTTVQAQALYTSQLAETQEEIALLRAIESPSRLQRFRLQCLEEYVEDLLTGAELADALAADERERAAEFTEMSEALSRAIDDAMATGCAIVQGGRRLGLELARMPQTVVTRRGALTTWAVRVDDGELRLVVMDCAYRGALSWRADHELQVAR